MLVGDLGFLYDLNALWGMRGLSREVQLTIVVVDNGGGGIFDAFPELKGLGDDVFERVAFAPHETDIEKATEGLQVPCTRVEAVDALVETVLTTIESGGVQVVCVPIDRDASSDVRKKIQVEVAQALGRSDLLNG